MKFFLRIFWCFIYLLVVASEQREICQNCPDKIGQDKGHVREAEGLATENYSRKGDRKTGTGLTRTAAKERLKGRFEILKDLNESYPKSKKVLHILKKVLVAVRKYLNATTVAVFGSPKTINFNNVAADNRIALLMVKNKVDWRIGKRFNNNIVSIIFLASDYSREDSLFNVLRQPLYGLRLKKIIIIKDTLAVEQDTQLLGWFYARDFWQVLVMDAEGNTLVLEHITGKVLRNRTLEEFMQSAVNWRNLQGAAINCSMTVNPPLSFIEYDAHKNVILKGGFGSLISLFAQHYNASLKSFRLINLTEIACSQYIVNEELDMCSNALTLDERYLITDPKELTNCYLMVPHGKLLARFYYFLKPFQQNVWSVVIVSFFYKVLALSFIHRLQHGSSNCGLHILYALLSVLYLPFHLAHVKPPYRRFLEILMICVGFVVATWYLSVLSSILFTRIYSRDIQSLQSLRDHNISILVDEYEYSTLNFVEVDSIIRQQVRLVPDNFLAEHRRNLNPEYAYYSDNKKIDFYLYQQQFMQRPQMKVLKPAVKKLLGGIPTRLNWPFFHLLNRFYKRLVESGIYGHFYIDAVEESIHSGYLHFFYTEQHYVEPLSIEYFQMPAMLLAGGFLLAFMAFLLEVFVFKVFYESRF